MACMSSQSRRVKRGSASRAFSVKSEAAGMTTRSSGGALLSSSGETACHACHPSVHCTSEPICPLQAGKCAKQVNEQDASTKLRV